MADTIERPSSNVNPKIHSDSGYGSNKSNSQSQRSSGSSKSQQSSLSSGSGTGYPPHPNAPVSNSDCQPHPNSSPAAPGPSTNQVKRQGKTKKKLDRKSSAGDKNDSQMSQIIKEDRKMGVVSQPMEQGNLSMPSTPQMSQSQMSPASTHDNKALQVAALTHALSCVKKFQDTIPESEMTNDSEDGKVNEIQWQNYFSEDFTDANEESFAAVVSLDDGVVVYLTPDITNILGFPKDTLLGRSFIEFMHPKDRMAFASHITCGINFPTDQNPPLGQNNEGPSVKSEPFYCRLRQYRGINTIGFGVTDKTLVYHPFKMTMQLKKVEIEGNKRSSSSEGRNGAFGEAVQWNPVYLVIGASKLKSAYQYSEEILKTPGKFVTRHNANCNFVNSDADAISYLGHLPQDLIGNSALDYYHPEDMDLLKDIYEAVLQEQGKSFRSKPYRFRVFNGTFAMLETDWSCFINPWSWKLEFVIGQHRVVQGPANPNVFMEPKDYDEMTLPDEIISDGKEMQNEIRRMLSETVARRNSNPLRQQSSRRRKDLASLMETLLEQMAKTENSDKSGSQCSQSGFSVMERDSVMLGEISPHTVDDNSGSNESSSTPPSYNQLNYRENIERFFQSQPKTERSEESGGESSNKMDVQNQSSDSDNKSSPIIDYSSGSNIRNSDGSGSNESGNDRSGDGGSSLQFGSGSLTQELLTRHNEDMEKFMMQRHKESRTKNCMTPGSHKECRHCHRHSEMPYPYPVASSKSIDDSSDLMKFCRLQRRRSCHKCDAIQGLKRAGNFSYDLENPAKHPHLDDGSGSNGNMADIRCGGPNNSLNPWPPFSFGMTPGVTTPSYSSAGYGGVGVTNSSVPTAGYSNASGIAGMDQMNRISNGTHAPNGFFNNSQASAASYVFAPGCGQQFNPHQQVQLMPTGVVYQPISPYGQHQHPPILMSLGAMMQHGQSIFLGPPTSSSQVSTSSSEMSSSNTSYMSLPTSNSVKTTSSNQTPVFATTTNSHGPFPGTHSSGHRKEFLKPMTLPIRSRTKTKGIKMEDSGIPTSFDGSGSDDSMATLSSKEEEMDQQFTKDSCKEQLANCQKSLKNVRSKEPPWLEKVAMTPEISLRYTIPSRDLGDILEKDLQALKIIGKQSSMVNDQLSMLYTDLADDGMEGNALYADEGISSSSGGEEQTSNVKTDMTKKMKKRMNLHQYTRVAIIHEENAPFPPDNFCAPAIKMGPMAMQIAVTVSSN